MAASIRVISVVGGQDGDEGKGDVVHVLSQKVDFDLGIRSNGSHNAGHTVYVDGKNGEGKIKVVTHMIPTTVLRGIPSVIGATCHVNWKLLAKEAEDVGKYTPKPLEDLLMIAHNANVVLEEHMFSRSTSWRTASTTRSGPQSAGSSPPSSR
jgi:adenylosuccinate synthase